MDVRSPGQPQRCCAGAPGAERVPQAVQEDLSGEIIAFIYVQSGLKQITHERNLAKTSGVLIMR